MATTWIKPIHVNKGKTIAQTINERNNYIKNPEKTTDHIISHSTGYASNPHKTHEGELVCGYGCDPRTVDEEFLLSKREYDYITGRSQGDKNILAYHIRQSFKPGEITPQEASEVGHELALRFTKGRHAFIVAVHTDKKHLHCHIIFNSTNIECTGKFNNFFGSSYAIRRLSDLICAEHGLSIVDNPKPSKGKTYGKWLGENRVPSWQEKLRDKIDEVLPTCSTFEAFLSAIKATGYTVRTDRKHITFCAPEQMRPTRLKSLGENYTEAAIRERLSGVRVMASNGSGAEVPRTQSGVSPFEISGHVRVSLLIDIQAKIREGKGSGYEQWARIFNLKQAAKTLLFLKENGIDSYDDLVKKTSSSSGGFNVLTAKIKATEKRLTEISELQKHIGTYGKTKEIYGKYKASGFSEKFYEEHRADIVLHQAAKKHFEGLGLKKLPSIATLKQEYATLLGEKKQLYAGYHSAKETMRSLLLAKDNADKILGIKPKAPERETSSSKRERNATEK